MGGEGEGEVLGEWRKAGVVYLSGIGAAMWMSSGPFKAGTGEGPVAVHSGVTVLAGTAAEGASPSDEDDEATLDCGSGNGIGGSSIGMGSGFCSCAGEGGDNCGIDGGGGGGECIVVNVGGVLSSFVARMNSRR